MVSLSVSYLILYDQSYNWLLNWTEEYIDISLFVEVLLSNAFLWRFCDKNIISLEENIWKKLSNPKRIKYYALTEILQ